MPTKDHFGMILSGASPFAAENYRKALHAYHCFAGDPLTLLGEALADSPGFVMGHVLTSYLTLIGSNAEAQGVGVAAFEAAKGLAATDREEGHVAAIGALIAGEVRAAARLLEDVSIAYPRDALALQAGQLCDFLLGESRMLRDRIGRALPHWSADMPDYHAVLGMLAFGLEETGHYERAEAAGRRAMELERRNGWAQHAVAHVLTMQDRLEDGIAWMRADTEGWSHESFFQVHNWWHLALFHLGLGETDEVLALFDGPIWGERSDMAFDMVDATALLWRLKLKGVDVGERWEPLADRYEAKLDKGCYAFDDWHAMMAFVATGRTESARELIALQAHVRADNALFVGEVGLPVMEAVRAFGAGDYGLAIERLRAVRNRAGRFGGSHAQRDLLDLTLIEAAARQGDRALEKALRAERQAALPLAHAPADRRLAA
jgi:hypothetical protein